MSFTQENYNDFSLLLRAMMLAMSEKIEPHAALARLCDNDKLASPTLTLTKNLISYFFDAIAGHDTYKRRGIAKWHEISQFHHEPTEDEISLAWSKGYSSGVENGAMRAFAEGRKEGVLFGFAHGFAHGFNTRDGKPAIANIGAQWFRVLPCANASTDGYNKVLLSLPDGSNTTGLTVYAQEIAESTAWEILHANEK